jgi:hypothetical protein
LVGKIAVLMLDVGDCVWKVLISVEEMLYRGFCLERLNEAISQNTVCETIRSQRDGLTLALKTLLKILRLCPSLKHIVALEDISNNARNIF